MRRSSFSQLNRPTLLAIFLFCLLFSGPPSLRLRSPEDSLERVLDLSAIVQIVIWVSAGIWTIFQLRKDYCERLSPTLGLPNKLGLVMILFLGLSTFESDAPFLTAFKVGQMFVCLLFAWLFVHRHGIAKCIDFIFFGSTILCVAIAISALIFPDLVLFVDEGKIRLRGDPIAVMGIVGTYSTILLIIKKKQIPRMIFWPLLVLLCVLLALSLTRQSWFLVAGFLVLYFAKQSKGAFRKLGFLFLAVFPFIFLFYVLPELAAYRSTDSVWSLTGRTDLWVYLAGVTLARSPWMGLGYYSASRILALDFNPGMGTAHSILIEVLLGGGILALIPCLALCFILSRKALAFVLKGKTELQFTVGVLFIVTMALGLMGGDFGYGEVGITFWCLATAIPVMALEHAQTLSPARVRKLPMMPRVSRPSVAMSSIRKA